MLNLKQIFLFILIWTIIILKSVSIVFANNCFYIKKVEYKNDKIINSITEYKCKTLKKDEGVNLKSSLPVDNFDISAPKIIDTETTYIYKPLEINKNYGDTIYSSSRPVSHTEYMNMVYYNDNHNPISEYQPKGLVGKILYTFARIILLQ